MNDTIIIGDTLDFVTSVANYPASAGWTLKYRLIPRVAGPTPIDITAATYLTDDYRVQVAKAVTGAWTAGEYSWVAYVDDGTTRVQVDEGTVTIKADPVSATAFDARSFAKQMLDAVEAALLGKATANQLDLISHSIGIRAQQRDVATLMPLRDKLRAEVASEIRKEKLAAGMKDPYKIGVRFNRV